MKYIRQMIRTEDILFTTLLYVPTSDAKERTHDESLWEHRVKWNSIGTYSLKIDVLRNHTVYDIPQMIKIQNMGWAGHVELRQQRKMRYFRLLP